MIQLLFGNLRFIGINNEANCTLSVRSESEHNPRKRPLRRWLGIMPKNCRFVAAYVRTRDVLRTNPSTISRSLENYKFSGLHPARWLGLLLHKTPVPMTQLVW